jgi:hypothetical protein
MSAGYLAISHPAWCDRIRDTQPHRCAFWRRATTRFRVLEPGDPFFLLRKQQAGRPLRERRVIGHAEYVLCENRPLHELTGYYGLNELGVSSQKELEDRLVEIAWDADPNLPAIVGVLQLGPLKEFRHPVDWLTLPKIGIRFRANVVQGMGLDEAQVEGLLDAGLYGSADV